MSLILTSLATAAVLAGGEATISARLDRTTVKVSPTLYGIFFEEINRAGDGGIYPELLMNRGFERGEDGKLPLGWKGEAVLDAQNRLNSSRNGSVRWTGELRNDGFSGVPLQTGRSYRMVVWTKGSSPLQAVLKTKDGKPASAPAILPASAGWQRHESILKATANDPAGALSLTSENGAAWLGYASLKPTNLWKGRFRKDLGQKVAAIQPSFVRFPGGCFVEGHDLAQAWNWKDSLGPIESRKGMRQILWGYPISNGLGFHEYLQLTEDLGASALFVANCGMSHSQVQPMEGMDRYVQDALDAIEYANGPITTTWGAKRALNGHPQPFNLQFLQIGNENGGPAYNERYALMAKAIKAKHPEVKLIANVWGGVPTSYPLEIIDEHYYSNPAFFWMNANRYDRYNRRGPKIYVGEYAVTQQSGLGNLAAALGEAAFMTGMERNSDIVTMSSYAPLFANVNHKQWNPDAINFDSHRSYGTPSYWVQTMFGGNRPDRVVDHQVKAPIPTQQISGGVGLQTWRTHAEFKDVTVEVDGKTTPLNQWRSQRGDWSFGETISQSSLEEGRRATAEGFDLKGADRYTISAKARKVSGAEGFIVMFGLGSGQAMQFNLGGWGNERHAFQVGEGGAVDGGVPGSIEAGRWYDLRIEGDREKVRGYLDGKLIQEAAVPRVPDFAGVVGVDDDTREVVVKLVNGSQSIRPVRIDLEGRSVADRGLATVLTGPSLEAENTLDRPDNVAPVRTQFEAGRNFVYRMPARSVAVLRMKLK
ncbi:MAG TPA: alpha-L-arabinofuranosidase C-terminal domain-containing protein [Fimbriimonas sp.]